MYSVQILYAGHCTEPSKAKTVGVALLFLLSQLRGVKGFSQNSIGYKEYKKHLKTKSIMKKVFS